tara:strand:- start:87 stop:1268 length:1182 start_codon:yes stop_codon:yes gene_type:complete
MTTAYFNLIGGLSGDMLLSSLFDSGLDHKKLHSELKKIDDIDFNFVLEKSKKHNINGTHTEVVINDSIKWNWKQFYKIINNSKLSESVIEKTIKCFDLLKQAEESAHSEKNPHLHELGTSDTVIDICGFFVGLDLLGISEITCSSIPVTSGFITTSHGTHETLAPATKKIVEKYKIPIRYMQGASNIETVTPTGLSILASIGNFDKSFTIKPSHFGVGLGTKNFEKFPNVLTVTISSNQKENIVTKKILLETNIDDMSPEITGSLIDQAHSQGALDCWISNYYGKKNRPGMTFHILCENTDRDKFSNFILENTSSLGFRIINIEREETERSIEEFNSSFGKIKIKFKHLDNKPYSFKVEYDDILEISVRTGLSPTIITKQLDFEINKKYKFFS